ncbi:MAG TPA: winged helix DNA-binding domain-containing protein [Acidimicrobiia bacterium]|nr:winged helix DNA-binding domain-containing protein [Acidimicrobiia bacterium]
MRKVDTAERRARLGKRQGLAIPVDDAVSAARSVLALHSSDPTTVFFSTWARVPEFEVGDLEMALYEDRSLLRLLGMRRTLWVVDRETATLVNNSSTRTIAERERRRTARLLERAGVTDDGAAWLDDVMPVVLGEIRQAGELLTRDLTSRLDGLDERIEVYSETGKLQGSFGLTSRAVLQLSFESRVIRTRPAGTWVSGQYRWADMASWLGGPIAEMRVDTASASLVTRWLHVFGPASEADLKWWTGWNLGQVRRALEDVGAVEVEIDTGVGFVLADDEEPVDEPAPWVALLPSLDPTPMGWKQRDWYMGGHAGLLFDRNGNAGPTVWVNGRVVGGWAQRRDGSVIFEVFDDVGREATDAIALRAARLEAWLGDTVVTPRFRSPHDKRLVAG